MTLMACIPRQGGVYWPGTSSRSFVEKTFFPSGSPRVDFLKPKGIQMPKVLDLSESQVWLAERNPTGFLVALWLSPERAAKLAAPGGEDAASLHVTLAYCGDAAEMDELTQVRAIAAIDEIVRYRDKLEGTISGYGRFVSSGEDNGKDVFYASPDVPQLAELRQCIVDCLMGKGVSVSSDHGFVPHITLAYLDPEELNPLLEIEDTSLSFDAVTVMSGSRRIDIPFWTPEPSVYMSESYELPLDSPLGASPARALFGDFNKEWIPFLPKPGKYQHEVFGNLDFTADTYTQILKNFDDYVFKQDLPIKATHTDPAAGAVGWIRPGGLRLAEDGSVEAKPEWNELGKGLVEDDRFLYTSAEFCKIWTNPVTQEKIPNVAVGLALVTRPHFKTDVLSPLSEGEALAFGSAESVSFGKTNVVLGISDGETSVSPKSSEAGEAREGSTMIEPEVKGITPPEVTPSAVTTAAPAAANPLDPNNSVVLSDLTQVVITAEQRNRERQLFSDLNTRVELAERRATKAEAELAEKKKEHLIDKFTAEVIGRSAENGQPWFGDPKANVNHLVSLAETYGEDSSEVRWAVTQKRNEAAAIRNTGIFDPISVGAGNEGASATAQITRFAEQNRQADPNLTMEQAVSKAYEDNPDLYVRSLKK
jgi:hypothetical protein